MNTGCRLRRQGCVPRLRFLLNSWTLLLLLLKFSTSECYSIDSNVYYWYCYNSWYKSLIHLKEITIGLFYGGYFMWLCCNLNQSLLYLSIICSPSYTMPSILSPILHAFPGFPSFLFPLPYLHFPARKSHESLGLLTPDWPGYPLLSSYIRAYPFISAPIQLYPFLSYFIRSYPDIFAFEVLFTFSSYKSFFSTMPTSAFILCSRWGFKSHL